MKSESDEDSYEEFQVDWKRAPFKLTFISNTGFSCTKCASGNCHGCVIPMDDTPLAEWAMPYSTVSVDWEVWVLKDHYDREESTVRTCTTPTKTDRQLIYLQSCSKRGNRSKRKLGKQYLIAYHCLQKKRNFLL